MTTIASDSIASIKSDWCFIGLDETKHWNLPGELAEHVQAIRTVYVFNRSEHTHCCELTPSYWMTGVDFTVDWKPGFYDLPDSESIRERMDNVLLEVARYQCDCYMQVRAVESMLARDDVPKYYLGELEDEQEMDAPQTFDRLFELWNAHPRF